MKFRKDYVFIIHSFDEVGKIRAKQLADILGMLDIQTVFGENFCGERVSEGVRDRLEGARLAIALLTKVTDINKDNNGQLSPWINQEITWAVAHKIPTLLLVEEGVRFDEGINGDLERICFKKGDFASAVFKIADQARTLMNSAFVPEEPPETTTDGILERLILKARDSGLQRRWDEVERLSEEALKIEPKAWRAMLSLGVAQLQLGCVKKAEKTFLRMLKMFGDNEQALAAVHHNRGWVEEVQSAGGRDPESLQKQIECYERSLTFDPSRVHTRASLLLCRVLKGERDETNKLLEESLEYRGFLKALGYEVENRGWQGHLALNALPDWLYPVLFPKWESRNDGREYLAAQCWNEGERKMRYTILSKMLAVTVTVLVLAIAALAESGQLG